MPSAAKGAKLERKAGINPKVHGNIPGVPVLTIFANRWACSNAGVHAPPQGGIHGSQACPAFSVMLSGGYEDDCDMGETFTYTGEGGRKAIEGANGKKSWSTKQCMDQEWVRGNKGLQLSHISGKPVRVVRGHTLLSRYAPVEGYRYDGLYKVTAATRAVGKTGFKTCQFTFERLPGQPDLPEQVLPPTPKKIKTDRARKTDERRTTDERSTNDDEPKMTHKLKSLNVSSASPASTAPPVSRAPPVAGPSRFEGSLDSRIAGSWAPRNPGVTDPRIARPAAPPRNPGVSDPRLARPAGPPRNPGVSDPRLARPAAPPRHPGVSDPRLAGASDLRLAGSSHIAGSSYSRTVASWGSAERPQAPAPESAKRKRVKMEDEEEEEDEDEFFYKSRTLGYPS
ncbi:PUA-like domain-containing protein [Mycena latifolia]|nr:PUA-like domain-containing protein [Mycena latifolia]